MGAQQAQPDTYAGFDGQPVTDVEITANPTVNENAMRELIQQKSGQPFSSDAVRKSTEALQQTHMFTAVEASVTPEQDGLRVLFVLEPVDYVGVVNFVGTGPNIPYTGLLQAANVPEQSPFFSALENDATTGVATYLRNLGYFAAKIRPEVQRDAQHHVVNLTFYCTLGKQARIRNIEFNGLSPQQSDEIRRSLRGVWARVKRVSLKSGQKYSQREATKSIGLIRDRLRTQKQLAPSVRLASARYEPDTNRVDVTFDVKPGPRAEVQVNGAHISQRKIRRLVPIYEEGAVDQDLVDEGKANLQAYLQAKDYFSAAVTSHMDQQDDLISVIYDVDRGAKHRVKSVSFEGNQHFSTKKLQPQVSIKKGFLFLHGSYSGQLLKKSVASLVQLYKNDGFSDISIQPEVKESGSAIAVTFRIQEGMQDTVASLEVTGNKTQSFSDLSRKYPLPIRTGGAFSQQELDTGRGRLLAAYLDLGYPNVSIRSSASPSSDDRHKINVTYTVDEGPKAVISDVVVLGSDHTKPEFIEQITNKDVKSGQPQSEGSFLQAESDLYDLGVFDWTSIKPLRPITDQTSEETLIKVHDSPRNSMDIGGGIEIIPRDGNVPVNSVAVPGIPPVSLGDNFTVSQNSFVSPRFTFDFSRHDLRGQAETATIGTIVSRLDQRIFFTYGDPRLHGSSWSALVGASVERTTENPIYGAELGNASLQIDKALDRKKTKHVIARYSFQRTDLFDILIPGLVLPQDQHVRLSTFDGEFLRDTRDKPLDAHRGIYQTFDFGVTAKPLGASADFARFLGQTAFYRPVRPWLVWANNFRLGLAQPFSGSQVPLSEEFFSGGADSLRGFPINGAGPQRPVPVCSVPSNASTCSLISVPVGGDMLFIVNSEGRFSLPVSIAGKQGLGGVVFYDGGNVYADISLRQFADNFTHTVGAGIRYQTPVGPVRFDVGYRLTPIPGISAVEYFVTLGQSF